MHQGYPTETLVRFLKARDWNVSKAHKMVRFFYITQSVANYKLHIVLKITFYLSLYNLSNSIHLFQLVDCLHWRIENEIDNILAVSSLFSEHSYICDLLFFFSANVSNL